MHDASQRFTTRESVDCFKYLGLTFLGFRLENFGTLGVFCFLFSVFCDKQGASVRTSWGIS